MPSLQDSVITFVAYPGLKRWAKVAMSLRDWILAGMSSVNECGLLAPSLAKFGLLALTPNSRPG